MDPSATPSSSAWVSVLAFSTHTKSGSRSRAAYKVSACELPAAISRSPLPTSAREPGRTAPPLICRPKLDAGDVLRGNFQARCRQMCVPGGERLIDFRVSAHRRDLEL